jgi:hypothetical protein
MQETPLKRNVVTRTDQTPSQLRRFVTNHLPCPSCVKSIRCKHDHGAIRQQPSGIDDILHRGPGLILDNNVARRHTQSHRVVRHHLRLRNRSAHRRTGKHEPGILAVGRAHSDTNPPPLQDRQRTPQYEHTDTDTARRRSRQKVARRSPSPPLRPTHQASCYPCGTQPPYPHRSHRDHSITGTWEH